MELVIQYFKNCSDFKNKYFKSQIDYVFRISIFLPTGRQASFDFFSNFGFRI